MTVLAGWEAGEPRSDGDLALAAAAGDRGAFACIYDRYAHRLHDFCVGMLGDREAAADCVQDAFCTAVTCLSDLREPDKLRPWLYAIVRSEALRRIRHNSRERTTDEVPEHASADASPDTLAARMELADLIEAAAGGLSDRDRSVLELAFRQGLDGPELAVALGVSQTNANTLVYRLRETIERSLGALLVSRRVRANPELCPQLAVILADWDGQFTVLVRKRVARHIESCARCDRDRRRLVSPAALLGAAPVLIPAPAWLRRRTLDGIRLTCAETDLANAHPHHRFRTGSSNGASAGYIHATAPSPDGATGHRHRLTLVTTLLIGVPFVILGTTIAWVSLPHLSVAPIGATSEMVTPPSAAAPPPPTPALAPVRPTAGRAAPPVTRPQQSRTAVPTAVMPRETVTSTAAPVPAVPDPDPSAPPLPPSPPLGAPAPRITITFAPPITDAPSLQIPSFPSPMFPRRRAPESASTPAQQQAPPPAPAQAPDAVDVPPPPAPAPPASSVPVPVPTDPYPIIR